MAIYPKVLIVGQSFNKVTGGGITLSNLFGNWDPDKLAVVCSPYLIDGNTDFVTTSNYYQLGHSEHKWRFPFNLFKRKYLSGPITPPKKDIDKPKNSPSFFTNLRNKFIENFFFPTLSFFGAMSAFSTTRLSPEVVRWVEDFSPDLIYAQTTSRNGLIFTKAFQEQFSYLPFVFHMMDDWPSTVRYGNILGMYWEKVIDREFRDFIQKCSLCLSISDYMAEEYQKRYGVTFIPFHNPINVEFWQKGAKSDYAIGTTCEILYAGRLGLGLEDSLERVAEAVELVNKQSIVNVKLHLQTPQKPSWANRYHCVVHRPLVDYQELPLVFGQADFLILPYDFESKSLAFIKYSMPTKAPEYFASGTPTIVFAPKDTALVRYVEHHECAALVCQKSTILLQDIILKMIDDQSYRSQLGTRARNIVTELHNSQLVTRKFTATLLSILNK